MPYREQIPIDKDPDNTLRYSMIRMPSLPKSRLVMNGVKQKLSVKKRNHSKESGK